MNFFYPHCPEGIYGVKSYHQVKIKEVYPNIDWVLYINEKGVKYDFVVNPGGNIDDIVLAYKGADLLMANKDGSITATTVMGNITEQPPISFQNAQSINTSYLLSEKKEIQFYISDYDAAKPLVIDPYLEWGTMYGGSSTDQFHDAVVDGHDDVITTGTCQSIDYPTFDAGTFIDDVIGVSSLGSWDIIITKFSNSGKILWSTYYGGRKDDSGIALDVDSKGNLFITGRTNSTDFPIKSAGGVHYFDPINIDGSLDARQEIYLLKFTNDGHLLWSTYFGETGYIAVRHLTIDKEDNVYIVGGTDAHNLPLLPSESAYFDPVPKASGHFNMDAFITKFNKDGALRWSTYYGGSNHDIIRASITDMDGNLFIIGETASSDFPLQRGVGDSYFDDVIAGDLDLFITKFNPQGIIEWSTYMGGEWYDGYEEIEINSKGDLYMVGFTFSATFPILNSGGYLDDELGEPNDIIITRFNNNGKLIWSTYMGGDGEFPTGQEASGYTNITIDSEDQVYICIWTTSENIIKKFPCTFYKDNTFGVEGTSDHYIAQFSPNDELVWATYFGSDSSQELMHAIVTDSYDNIFVVGEANTPSSGGPYNDPGNGAWYSNTGMEEGMMRLFQNSYLSLSFLLPTMILLLLTLYLYVVEIVYFYQMIGSSPWAYIYKAGVDTCDSAQYVNLQISEPVANIDGDSVKCMGGNFNTFWSKLR